MKRDKRKPKGRAFRPSNAVSWRRTKTVPLADIVEIVRLSREWSVPIGDEWPVPIEHAFGPADGD